MLLGNGERRKPGFKSRQEHKKGFEQSENPLAPDGTKNPSTTQNSFSRQEHFHPFEDKSLNITSFKMKYGRKKRGSSNHNSAENTK